MLRRPFSSSRSRPRGLFFRRLAFVSALSAPFIWKMKCEDTPTKYNYSLTRYFSHLYGRLFRLEVPVSMRRPLYSLFAKVFKANLEENKLELEAYRTFDDFFTREVKEETRPMASAVLVSPCDGRVLSLGEVTVNELDSIKGRNYKLTTLLTGNPKLDFTTYINSLKQTKDTKLKYATIYLAPGDCHRFVSPAEWKVNFRRHMTGYLLGVFDLNLWRKGDVFSINERVAYFGDWLYGGLHMIMVGAYNVGSIEIHCDKTLATNTRGVHEMVFETTLEGNIKKGEGFGAFHGGSTIILLVEMPDGCDWGVKQGEYLKFGQSLLTNP